VPDISLPPREGCSRARSLSAFKSASMGRPHRECGRSRGSRPYLLGDIFARRRPSAYPLAIMDAMAVRRTVYPAVAAAGLLACEATLPTPHQPRLFDRVCATLRARHYSRRTEKAYVAWIRRFILFHHKRHPLEMGAAEVTQFLSFLVVDKNVTRPPRIKP
jgi:hypothetical protein